MASLQQVNLLRAELVPSKETLTMSQMLVAVLLFSGLLSLLSLRDGVSLLSAGRDLAAGENRTAHLAVEIETLRTTQAGNEKSLRAELARLQQKRTEKAMLAQLLSSGTANSGRAQNDITTAMVALAEGAVPGLWLEEIGIYPHGLRLRGHTSDAVLVPRYLQNIAAGSRFQGHRFEMVELLAAEQGRVMFSLTSPRVVSND